MYCIAKDRKTFRTITGSACAVVDYSLTLDSIYDETSEISITGAESAPTAGDFIYLENGYQGIAQEVEKNDGRIDLKCRQVSSLFSRELYYSKPEGETLEMRLKNMIDTNYTKQPDGLYRLPYLEVRALTSTSADTRPEIDDNGIYTVDAYMAKLARLHNIFVTCVFGRDTLAVEIARKVVPSRKIDFSDPGLNVTEQAFSCEKIGKITSRAEDTGKVRDWYLLRDGTITNSADAPERVEGDWKLLTVREEQDTTDAVADEFRSNSYSHKITFTAAPEKARFSFYDRVTIALDGNLFDSYIAAVRVKKDSGLTEYECGELRTTYPFKKLI